MSEGTNDAVEMWRTHAAIDLYLLSHLPDGGLDTSALGGHTIGQQFAHINDLRLRWVDETAPDLVATAPWFERQAHLTLDRDQLRHALTCSANAVEALIHRCAEADHGVEGFPGSPVAFLGYLISHESYHWGEMSLILSQAGLPLAPEVALGIWRGWWDKDAALHDAA
jgi:uncharacterized damage-inducible protein DinB